MAKRSTPELRIDHLFSIVAVRLDRWSELNKIARVWAAKMATKEAAAVQAQCADALEELLPLEDFHAYPGARLLGAMRERISAGDAMGTARLAQRMSSALMSRSYRRDPSEWRSRRRPPAPRW
jgi:arginine decarboxylase